MAGEKTSIFDAPSVAFITGASRGIGRAIATEFAKRFSNKLLLVLTGRSREDLEGTVSLIQADPQFSPQRTAFKLVTGSLADPGGFPGLADDFFGVADLSAYRHAVLVNNAGSVGGTAENVRDMTSSSGVQTLQDYFFLNVTSPLLLASKFLSVFQTPDSTGDLGPARLFIVQISSLAAVSPIQCWGPYCVGKAARDMLHRVIAAEEPRARVLSYAPGPVDTAMLRRMAERSAATEAEGMMAGCQRVAVQPRRTASVLCDVLEEDEYESGAHVDLFDVIGVLKSD